MIAVDTNILVYAHRRESPHHDRALAVVMGLATGRAAWAVPWPCVHEFLAVTTHPRIYRPPSTAEEALSAIRDLATTATARFLSETTDHLDLLAGLLRGGQVLGPRVHDARVAAICLGHGVTELWSADRDFSWFPELTVRNPLV